MSLKNLSAKIRIPKLLKENLKNKRITKIYNEFEKNLGINKEFAVAVSGGPDSLALAFLSKIYSEKKKINSKFFIVDHKLRKESTKEAIIIQKLLKKNLISSEILTWKGIKPLKNIQSVARINRYELLFKRCDKFNIKHILLGHHQDDLFENFFIRMLRGSGLKGLISLDKKTNINGKNLYRPLLEHKKSDLIFLSNKVFNFYIQDPTNEDTKYLRIRVRKLIEELKKDGLDKRKFLQTIKNLKNSDIVVGFYVKQNLKMNSYFSQKYNKLILNEKFFNQPHEVVFRSLTESIRLIGRRYYPVRGKKLDRIIRDYQKNSLFKVTLGGCIIEKVNLTVIISKEN